MVDNIDNGLAWKPWNTGQSSSRTSTTDSSQSVIHEWRAIAAQLVSGQIELSKLTVSWVESMAIGLEGVLLSRELPEVRNALEKIKAYLKAPQTRTLKNGHGGIPGLKASEFKRNRPGRQ